MSLLVWLPLLGNYNNQGLDDATFVLQSSTGTLVSSNNGKIGKCCEKATAKKSDRLRSSKTFNLDGDITIACWANVTETVGDTANGLITNHNHGDASGVSINVKQISASDYRISCSTGSGSGSRTYNTYYGTTNIKGAWHHLVLTYEKTAKQLKLWVDGQVEYTLNNYTNYAVANYIDIFSWSTGYNAGDYDPACKMNDVRVYDSCLSDREIEILSRGLVAHYPLNGGGRGGDNLFRDTSMDIAPVNNDSTDWTKYFRWYNGGASIHTIENGTDTILLNSASNLGIAFQRKATDINLDSTAYYTISCEAKCDKPNAHLDIGLSYRNTSNNWVWRGGSNPQNFNNTTDWQKFTLKFKPDADTLYIDYCFTVVGASGSTNTLSIRKCKLEKGEIATPWMPNSADTAYTAMGYNSTTEYDVSGYGNNGVKNNITYNSNTARYSVCSKFDGSSTRIAFSDIYVGNEWSYGVWVKAPQSTTRGWENVVMLNETGSDSDTQLSFWLNLKANGLQSTANKQYNSTIPYPNDGNWHHFFATFDGSNLKTYIDGELVNTKAITNAWFQRTHLTIGAVRTGDTTYTSYSLCDLSDFRLYATALSATQVAELYNTAVSVANNGTLMGYELVEG